MESLTKFAYNNCGVETTFDWDCQGGGIMDVIINIFNWLSIGVIIIVIIFVVVGAISYMTAAGKQDQAKKGLETIRNAVIALALYLIMWSLLNYLIPGGIL